MTPAGSSSRAASDWIESFAALVSLCFPHFPNRQVMPPDWKML
jgi:hypothetical protein